MPYRIRRVVTGHGKDGRSVFVMDGKAPNILEMAPMPGVALTYPWRTRTSPASNAGSADAAKGKIKLDPPAEGTILRIVEFPPDAKLRKSAIAAKALRSIRAGGAPDLASVDAMIHATATVDLHHRAEGRDPGDRRPGREAPEAGRWPDRARHEPFMERPHQGTLRDRRRTDRRQASRTARQACEARARGDADTLRRFHQDARRFAACPWAGSWARSCY